MKKILFVLLVGGFIACAAPQNDENENDTTVTEEVTIKDETNGNDAENVIEKIGTESEELNKESEKLENQTDSLLNNL